MCDKNPFVVLNRLEEHNLTQVVSAMEIYKTGCVVKITTFYPNDVTESSSFVPDVRIQAGKDETDYATLVPLSY